MAPQLKRQQSIFHKDHSPLEFAPSLGLDLLLFRLVFAQVFGETGLEERGLLEDHDIMGWLM